MSLEEDLVSLLGPLVSGRIYPDETPDNPQFPLVVYQQIGGRAGWYMEKKVPSHKHSRMQISVFAKRRADANALARSIESALCESTLVAEPYGAFTALREDPLKLYGARQDFGIWYADPPAADINEP